MNFFVNSLRWARKSPFFRPISKLVHLKRALRPNTRIAIFFKCYSCMGFRQSLNIALWREKSILHVRPKGVVYPMQIRPSSTDLIVFFQIFIELEYGPLAMDKTGLIVDAGANVGYSSIYFLNRYSDCSVIAIEPDSLNYQSLVANLAPYKERAKLINRAVWGSPSKLYLRSELFRGGGSWARQYDQSAEKSSEPIQSVTIGDVLKSSGFSRITLLKMDIEGAEAVVFAAYNCQEWIACTDSIAIELHDDAGFGEASKTFFGAIQGHGFDVFRSGELVICVRGCEQ